MARWAVIGSLERKEARLQAGGGGQVINTAFVERLNAPFRSRLAPLIGTVSPRGSRGLSDDRRPGVRPLGRS